MLSLQAVSAQYDQQVVFNDVSFELSQGEILCLLGPSGCGKTTLLRSIAGFIKPTNGVININGTNMSSPSSNVAPQNRNLGMVFQDYALFPHLSVTNNITFGIQSWSKSEQNQRLEQLLTLTGLSEFKDRFPHELSGGQQQRVALARSLAPKPQAILLDEPFSNLDLELRRELAEQVRFILKQEKTSAIMVTHDQEEAFAIADKIALLADGKLHQYGNVEALYLSPKTAFTAEFFGDGQWYSGNIDQNQLSVFNQQYTVNNELDNGQVKIMVRPEHLTISDDGIQAKVIKKHFNGGYIELLVELEGTAFDKPLSLRTTNQSNIAVNDLVKVQFSPSPNMVFTD